MDLEEMTIYKAKSLIRHLENTLRLKLELKELNFYKTQPNAVNTDKVSVMGGTREDKFASYVIKDDSVDNEIILIQEQIQALNRYVEEELKRLDEFDEWEQKVIYMRESRQNWIKIACSTPFSESTCKRIYRKYKKRRDI